MDRGVSVALHTSGRAVVGSVSESDIRGVELVRLPDLHRLNGESFVTNSQLDSLSDVQLWNRTEKVSSECSTALDRAIVPPPTLTDPEGARPQILCRASPSSL